MSSYNDFITKDDVSLFLEDFWPSYQKQKFPLGQAFFNFLQVDMHYSWALEHYKALSMPSTDEDHMKYILQNAV